MAYTKENFDQLMADNKQFLEQQVQQTKVNQELIKQQTEQSRVMSLLLEKLMKPQDGQGHTISTAPELTIESLANTIETFNFDPDSGSTFDAWYARFEDVFTEDAKSLDDAARVRLLLRKLNTHTHKLYSDYLLPLKSKSKTFKETVQILTKIFAKPDSLFCLRWKCLQLQKENQEDFTAYAANVNRLCEDFKLGELTPDQFKCLIYTFGLKNTADKDVRTRLLNKMQTEKVDNLNLALMVEESNRIVNIKSDTALGTVNPDQQINQISGHSRAFKKRPNYAPKSKNEKPKSPCWHCGGYHFVKFCPFGTHKCTDCHQTGHKEGYCRSNNKRDYHNKGKFAKMITVQQTHNNTVTINKVDTDNRKMIEISINDCPISMQLDTAADISCLSVSTWTKLGQPILRQTNTIPFDAQGNRIPIVGELNANLNLNGITIKGHCLVAEISSDLFGSDWISLFNLWDKPFSLFCNQIVGKTPFHKEAAITEIKNCFPEVFNNTFGACDKIKVKLHLLPNAKPTFKPKRQVPFHIISQLDEELDRLQNSGIITPVSYSEFGAPIVVVRKPNGKIRICGDYSTGLNNSLQPHQYPIPTPDHIFSSLANCAVFSQIDLSDAYLQLEMDEESRRLLTINTHRGLYTFNRLCPGVKPASGIFQQTMDTMLAGLNHVTTFLDDILVSTKDFHQHQIVLKQVFQRLQDYNFKVRLDKCHFFQSSIRFLGVIIDSNGQRPDADKVKAIQTMPPPTNVAELRSFLGAIAFYGRFIKSISTLREPMDKLLKKDIPFVWSPDCQKAFNKFKEVLQSDLLLTHFDPTLPISIASDASNAGIGSVAYHTYPDGSIKAFHHASRRLTKTEQAYSQIEKEALAIIFGTTKFHKYCFGRKFTLLTDHRPLLTIFGSTKGIPAHTANRLQRWALILLSYDFDIKYIGTTEFGHADILSRLIADRPKQNENLVIASIKMENEIQQIITDDINSALPVSFNDIGRESKNDPTLQEVAKYIINGWPHKSAIKSREVLKYYNFKDSLSLIKNCLIFKDRTVVPPKFRGPILAQLHSTHPGISRMKALARSYVHWPNMDEDITAVVKSCEPCASTAKLPVKSLLSSWPIPNRPWERVHADFAGPLNNNEYYLILVDAYSKWPEVFPLSSITTEQTIIKISEVCARFGCMTTLVTDNGPQFTSALFQKFCKERNISHVFTPIYHPQSNGLAERFVDTIKRALKKSYGNKLIFLQDFLQNYRATPNSNAPNGFSPAELMMKRKITLPLDSVRPDNHKLHKRNRKMEQQFNEKHGAKLRTFQKKEEVRVRITPNGKWIKAHIIEPVGKVLYNLFTENGRFYQLHVNHIQKAKQSLPIDMLVDEPEPTSRSPPNTPKSHRNWRAITRKTPPVLRPRPVKQQL